MDCVEIQLCAKVWAPQRKTCILMIYEVKRSKEPLQQRNISKGELLHCFFTGTKSRKKRTVIMARAKNVGTRSL